MPGNELFDAVLGPAPQGQPATAPQAAAPAPVAAARSGSLFDTVLGPAPTAGNMSAPAPQSYTPTSSPLGGNIFDTVLGPPAGATPQPRGSDLPNPSIHFSQAPVPSDDEAQRMGQGQDWYNKPLTTSLLGLGEYREGAGPVERGLEKFATGLTSPLNLALMLVTGGFGGLAEAGAVTAGEVAASEGLSTAGRAMMPLVSRLGPEAAEKVASASGVISKLANAGFTLQQIAGVATAVPRLADAIKSGDYDTAEEMATQAALGSVAAGLSGLNMVHSFGGLSKEPALHATTRVFYAEKGARQKFYQKAYDFAKANKELIENKDLDTAARLYHRAGGDNTVLQGWRDRIASNNNIKTEIQDRWVRLLDEAQNLPQAVKDFSLNLREDYQQDWLRQLELGVADTSKGIFSEGRQNYSGTDKYTWRDENGSTLRYVGKRGYRGSPTKYPEFTKPAKFDNIIDALEAGFEPKEIGLAAARHDYILKRGDQEAAFAAEKELAQQAGEDGRPGAVWGARSLGNRKIVPVPKGADLNGFAEELDATGQYVLPTMPMDSEIFQRALGQEFPGMKLGDLTRSQYKRVALVAEGMKAADKAATSPRPTAPMQPILQPDKRLVIHDGKYYYDVGDYSEGPKVFSRTRTRDGVHFEKAPPLVHPDFADKIKTGFEDHSWFQKNPLLRTLLSLSTGAKRNLLSFSPFHTVTEYWRGIQMGLKPWEALNPEPLTENSLAVQSKYPPTLSTARERALVQEGLASGSHLIEKIPLLGKAQHAMDEFLFGANGYIDRLKGATFEKVVDQLSKRHQNWTADQIHFAASRTVDAAFGGLDWKALGASANTRDFLRLMMLAPDFTGSQVLFGGYGMMAGGSVVAQSLMRIAAYNFGVAQLLNMLIGGKVRPDHPFSVVSPDGSKTYSIRTMPGDLYHMLTDPRGFSYNRMNPLLLRTGWEMVTQRNEQGKRATAEQQLHDVLRNVLPIPSQGVLQRVAPGVFGEPRQGETWYDSALRSVGVGAQPEVSYAQGIARNLAADHSPSGPVTEDNIDRHRRVLDLEGRLRKHEIDPTIVTQAVGAGFISQEDRKTIMKNYRETQGMTDQIADLYVKASHLPMPEFLQVYDVATSEEKAALHRMLIEKKERYMREHVRSDPTFQRLLQMFPPMKQGLDRGAGG